MTIFNYGYINTRVIPSYFSSQENGFMEDSGLFSTVQLLQGEVKKAIYPGDSTSNSSNEIEYTVDVEYRTAAGPASMLTFPNCRVANMFGGAADRCKYTLRADPSAAAKGETLGAGAKVLLLCLLGERNRAYIISGIRNGPEVDTSSDGHNYYWEFNGVSTTINKDGEYLLTFMGRTKANGEIDTDNGAKEEASGTSIGILKDGSLDLYTPKRAQFLKFDHDTGKVEFQADIEWNIQVNDKMIMNVGNSVDWTFGDKCTIAATKDTSIDVSSGTLALSSSGDTTIKSAGVKIGDASEDFPMFSTYRDKQATLHQDLLKALMQVGIYLNVAATAMKIPITGSIAASPSVQQAALALNDAVSAISTFESSSSQYKSSKNKND